MSWLSFLGRWGDERYPDSDPRQLNFLNLGVAWKYESGPTGPWDKGLDRTEVCPDRGRGCSTLSALPAVSGTSVPVTVSRASATGTGSPGGTMGTATASGSATTASTEAASVGLRNVGDGGGRALEVVFCVAWTMLAVAGIL